MAFKIDLMHSESLPRDAAMMDGETARLVFPILMKEGYIDRRFPVLRRDGKIVVPLVGWCEFLSRTGCTKWPVLDFAGRYTGVPLNRIRMSAQLPEEMKAELPGRWEMIGTSVLIKLGEPLMQYAREIGRAYCEILKADSAYAVVGRISGVTRKPRLRLIYGRGGETVHRENGVNYVLDVEKVMFSSSNHDERIRMASLASEGERVVDMFAGIGHLSMPLAVHSSPSVVIASEIDGETCRYLRRTAEANDVQHLYEIHNCDNRQLVVSGADRVIAGYLDDTVRWLPHALSMCRIGGTVHLHQEVERGRVMDWRKDIEQAADGKGRIVEIRRVKTLSAFTDHLVADIMCTHQS